MNRLIKLTAVIAIMSISLAGNAALITYDFVGKIESIFSTSEQSYECLFTINSCNNNAAHDTITIGNHFSGQFIFDLNTSAKDGSTQTAAFYSTQFYTQNFSTFPGNFPNISLSVTEQEGGNIRRYALQNLYWKTSIEGNSQLPDAFDFTNALFALAPAAGCDGCTVGGIAHVTIATSVPEPSILALLAIGLLSMRLARRKYC